MTHDALNKLCGGASVFLIIQENLKAINNQERSRVLRIQSVGWVPLNPKVPVSLFRKFRILHEKQN
jgi:hypothetical protein